MMDGRHFEKPLNCHISAYVQPILMKFGMTTHVGCIPSADRPLNIPIFENPKSQNRDLHEIW